MLLRITTILFPLFAITLIGWWVGRRSQPDLTHANKINMDVFVPALVFAALANKEFHLSEFLPLAAITFAMVLMSGLAAWLAARLCGVQVKTLVLPVMFNNCGNIGLPLAVLAFGEQALAPAVVMFMVSNLLHFSFGAWLLDHRTRLTTIWKVPSVAATLAGIGVSATGLAIWPPLLVAIKMLGDVSIPLMLFSLGVRLTDTQLSAWRIGLGGGILRPLVGLASACIILTLVDIPVQQRALVIVFGALPPAVLNFIFAERYRQEPEKIASIVMIGNLLSIVFLPIALALTLAG
ncbi:MAG: AEC family transporter [Betaproteobacteria bacterium]|nr:AEC family transporter [Betaproteobacteria bacterium]